MSHFHTSQRLEFNFEGQFRGFSKSDGKLKYLRLQLDAEEVRIKIPKELRLFVGVACHPGEKMRVSGVGKFDRATGEISLKARQILPAQTPSNPSTAINSPIQQIPKKSKIKVLICQKSKCLRHGGKGLYKTLEGTLRDRNLLNQVSIEQTGCLGKCSSAPNLMVMPGKHHFSKFCPATLSRVDQLLDKLLQT